MFEIGVLMVILALLSFLWRGRDLQQGVSTAMTSAIVLFVAGWPMNTNWQLGYLWLLGIAFSTVVVMILLGRGEIKKMLDALVYSTLLYLGFYLSGGFNAL